jgi:hypothetical protein
LGYDVPGIGSFISALVLTFWLSLALARFTPLGRIQGYWRIFSVHAGSAFALFVALWFFKFWFIWSKAAITVFSAQLVWVLADLTLGGIARFETQPKSKRIDGGERDG